MTEEQITINSGVIDLKIDYLHKNYKSIHDILGFASRRNAKRGFLFVSKILGKHIPVKPSVMRQSYNDLANMIGADKETTFIVGMSETATGMGGGMADSLARMNDSGDVFFQHTTRHELNAPKWFEIAESHSHAVSHIVYKPSANIVNKIEGSKRLVLADDEISTGKTLLQLAKGYLEKLKEVESIEIVSLVSWLSSEREEWFSDQIDSFCKENGLILPKVIFHAFAKGSFEFTKNPDFNEQLPEGVDKELATEKSTPDMGRLGVKMPIILRESLMLGDEQVIENNEDTKPVSVIGTGEHLYFPFLTAELFEKMGMDVVFQSTTRSPVYQDGEVIKNTTVFDVKRGNSPVVNHFIYNLDSERLNCALAESPEAEAWYSKINNYQD